MKSEMSNGEIVTKGTVGAGASIAAWWVSHVQDVNATLQTLSLILGVTIGIVSLVKLLRKKSKTKNHEK